MLQRRRIVELNKEISCIIKYLKEEKLTKPKEQDNIQPSRSDNSSPTEILPSENPGGVVESKREFPHEAIIVPPEMSKATITVIRPTTMEKDDSLSGRASDLMESMKDKTEEAFDSIKSATGQGVS
jgi:hypothetical protein